MSLPLGHAFTLPSKLNIGGRNAWSKPCVLSRTLLDAFGAGDLLLADALYANYFLVAQLIAAGVDVLLEQHGSRRTDFRRRGTRLAVRDHVVHWPKPRSRPAWMSRERYAAFPEQLTLREAQVGGRILVTTLLEADRVHKTELHALYRCRWNIELEILPLAEGSPRCRTTTKSASSNVASR